MVNIVIEGLDFMAKSSTCRRLSKKFGLLLVDKVFIENEFGDSYYDIKETYNILSELNKIDNAVFDRHFISILVYFKNTSPELYKRIIDEDKIIRDFIKNNKNSVLNIRYSSWKFLLERIEKSKLKGRKKFTEHDINLLDESYYKKIYWNIINLSRKIKEFNRYKDIKVIRHNMEVNFGLSFYIVLKAYLKYKDKYHPEKPELSV